MSFPQTIGADLASVAFTREGNMLRLTYATADSIVVVQYFDFFAADWAYQEIRFVGAERTVSVYRDQLEAIGDGDSAASGSAFLPEGSNAQGSGLLQGTDLADRLYATAFGTVLDGQAGDDDLGVLLDGSIFGISFHGGAGDDRLFGSYAGDVYRFDRGDGHDEIRDDVRRGGTSAADFFAALPFAASYQDRVEFGAGLTPQDVSAQRAGDDLLLDIAGGTDGLRIVGWYDGTMFDKIESFVFSDGTTWLAGDIDRQLGQASPGMQWMGAGTVTGSQYDDTLTALDHGTVLRGGLGDDHLGARLDGSVFGLVLDGGAGNDVLHGSYGGDTYLYAPGDGQDVIHDSVGDLGGGVVLYFQAHPDAESYQDRLVFGGGIASADVTPEQVGQDLVLHVRDGGSVTVGGWFSSIFTKIEHIDFADTSWLASDVDHRLGVLSFGVEVIGAGTLSGSQYDDSLAATGYGARLEGGAGNDTLEAAVDGGVFDLTFVGGGGDDVLYGSYARDVYRFAAGDGHDRISDDVRDMGPDVAAFFEAHPGTDTYQDKLVFEAGIAPSDITLERRFDDMVIHVRGDQGSITVQGWYGQGMFRKIEGVEFADGTAWLASDMDRMLGQPSSGRVAGGSGAVEGSQYDDTLTATGYGTRLEGGAGNDLLQATVDGGIFALSLAGGRGDDTLAGSYGGDTYLYDPGDGHDTVVDDVSVLGQGVADFFMANPNAQSYQDKVVFGAGISRFDVRPWREGSDMVLYIANARNEGVEDGSIRIRNWFADDTFLRKIERFEFADGSAWLASDMDFQAEQWSNGIFATGSGTVTGSQYNDTLVATAAGARLEGGAGWDRLEARNDGGVWDVHLAGGAGNDTLVGSYRGDTYYYNLAEGNDRIVDDVRTQPGTTDYFLFNPTDETFQDKLFFGEGITPDMVLRLRVGNDLVLSVQEGSEAPQVTVQDWFDGTPFNKIELIGFADGTAWTAAMAEQGLG
ncbi:calcium-binding protein [Ramlibacter sp. AN1133]|uniref:calcium-binding protein n=1 Tax=Ramlibacter sp. AN1133 TaxID=3133429 RepID=UPI0030C15C3E